MFIWPLERCICIPKVQGENPGSLPSLLKGAKVIYFFSFSFQNKRQITVSLLDINRENALFSIPLRIQTEVYMGRTFYLTFLVSPVG